MHVVMDGHPLLVPLAGVGHYTRQLVEALARVDSTHRYTVLLPHPVRIGGRRPGPRFAAPNVEVVLTGWWVTMWARLQRRLGHDREIGRPLDPPADVYHATNSLFPFRVRARRRVLTIHDLTLLLFPEWHPRERLAHMVPRLEPAVRSADRVIVPSEATRTDVLKLLPVDPERVSVIPDGVDRSFAPRGAEELEAGLAPFGLRRDGYLLFLSTIEPRKNVLRILEALDLTPPEVGPVVFAGGRGWNDAAILQALARPEHAGRVRRLGYVADGARPLLLAGARAFVYPSLYEGFGLPPLEALASGTPVITSNVSSLPEVMGDAALFVDPHDVPGLAAALTRVWHDDPLRRDLRARGLERARAFTWDRTARQTLDVYQRALDA